MLALVFLGNAPVRAGDFHWNGNGDGESWNDWRNWSTGVAPASDPQTNVWFGDAGSHYAINHHTTLDYAANDPMGADIATTDLGSFYFDNSSGTLPPVLAIDINGAPGTAYQLVTLYGGITLSNTSSTVAFNGGDNPNYPFYGELKLGNDVTFDVGTGATLQFNSNLTISGPYGITKNGAGTLTINGQGNFGNPGAGFNPSAFDGYSMFLNAGTLNINAPGFSARPVIISGGTIDNTSGQTIGAPYQSVWNGNFTYGGTNDLVFGKVGLTRDSTVNVAAGNLQITVGLGTQDINYYGIGVYSVTKTGPGTLTLSGGSNSSTNQLGQLTITQGRVVIGDPHDLGSNSGTVTIGDATLRIIGGSYKDDLHSYEVSRQSSTIEVINSAELNGVGAHDSIVGPGSLTVRGIDNGTGFFGTLILDQPAGFTGGHMTIESGTVEVRCDNGLPSSAVLKINAGGSYLLGPHQQTLAGLIVGGDAPLAGNLTIVGSSAGANSHASIANQRHVPMPWPTRATPDERFPRFRPHIPSADPVVVSVTQSGTLSGSGSIDTGSGRIVIDGALDPNGTIHLASSSSDVGALTLTSISILSFTISDSLKDLVALTSTNLTLAGGRLALDLPNTGPTGIDYSKHYALFTGINQFTGSFGSVTGYDAADYVPQFSFANGQYDLFFTMEPIPEPSTWAAAALAVAVIGYSFAAKRRSAQAVCAS